MCPWTQIFFFSKINKVTPISWAVPVTSKYQNHVKILQIGKCYIQVGDSISVTVLSVFPACPHFYLFLLFVPTLYSLFQMELAQGGVDSIGDLSKNQS